jgi:hypothetical protein
LVIYNEKKKTLWRNFAYICFQPKCEKYWPDSGTEKYGDIEVTLVNTEEFAYHVTHSLKLKKVSSLLFVVEYRG